LFQENIATLLPMFATLTKSGHPAQPMLPSCWISEHNCYNLTNFRIKNDLFLTSTKKKRKKRTKTYLF